MKHIKIDAALYLFPKKLRPYITILGELLVLMFAAYIVVTGVELTYKQWVFGKVSPALGLPLQYINAAPVVGFGLVIIRQIQTIWYLADNLGKTEEGGEE